MAYGNSSAAYDLSAYPEPRRKPELKAVRSPRRVISAFFTPQAFSSFAIVVTLICLIVYNQVQLNEVSGGINSLNAQLRELESDNVKLTSELESTIGMRTIGDYAKSELGMQRLEQYQTEYIQLQSEDKIELTESSPAIGMGEKIKLSMTSAITRLQEYIGSI